VNPLREAHSTLKIMMLNIQVVCLILIFVCAGCATYRDTKQVVYVNLSPFPADVYQNGQLVGKSPGYVRIRRQRSPSLNVVARDGTRESFRLQTHYRWAGSFASNLLFFTIAPVGWMVDLATGAAWSAEDPRAETKVISSSSLETRPIALAPLDGVDAEVSAELSMEIAKKLKANSSANVLPYAQTYPIFRYHSEEPGLPSHQLDRYNLLYELNAGQVWVGRAKQGVDGYKVQGHLHDVRVKSDLGEQSWMFPRTDSARSFLGRWSWLDNFKFLPNTVFLNFTNYNPSTTIAGKNYEGRYLRDYGFLNESFNYISMISLAYWERPYPGMRSHWKWGFTPALSFSKSRLSFDEYTPLQGTQFNRMSFNLGYGFEGGYIGRYGYVYATWIPNLTWTDISYKSRHGSGRATGYSIGSVVEIGYSNFLTRNLVFKLYSRSISEDSDLWRYAIHNSTRGNEIVDGVQATIAGVAIGYSLGN